MPFILEARNTDEKFFIENEKNTISITRKNIHSVVNVAGSKQARIWFDPDPIDIPSGAGSGIVWDDKGHIVTNYHVIGRSDSFFISFHQDQKQYPAKIIGVEPKKDIAVLKLIKRPDKLVPLKTGHSHSLVVGQKAISIGNPFGLDSTVTEGIVSALGRKIDGVGGVKIHGMIQTDAAINPGNSGGPLLNSRGQLIGMNTLIYSRSGSSAGVGFAVPVDTIKQIVPQLIKYKKVIRPVLGIYMDEYFQKRIDRGILIKAVIKDGPAHKAGLQGMGQDRYQRRILGDIILKIDNHAVNNLNDIYHILEKYKIGDKVSISYLRGKKTEKASLILGSN